MDEENIKDSHVEDSEIKESKIEESDIEGSQIKDSEIKESHIEDSKIEDSKIVGETIKENKKISEYFKKQEIKKYFNQTKNFLNQKKVINFVIISLLLVLLIGGSWIRLQNLPHLKDATTGEYIPLALDPFYFLRVAETMVEQGGLPAYDAMRTGGIFDVEWHPEILPQTVIFLHKIGGIFDKDVTIQFINVISPVIFFALALVIFFFLIYVLTKSKITAILSSALLTIIPAYLYRTLAGFSDHEAIGMLAFFLALLCYGLALKFLDKLKMENQNKQEKKNILIKTILWGLLVGFVSAFTIASWTGIAKFIFMIIPLSFGLFWLIKVQNPENLNKKPLYNFLIFYLVWFLSSILFGLLYGFDFSSIITVVVLGSSSLLTGAVFLFLIVDFSVIKLKAKINFISKEKLDKYRILFSGLIVIILGVIFFSLYGKNILSLISSIIDRLLHPFGLGRLVLTVAENAQPYLMDWMNQIGKIFFWLFYAGMVFVGINAAKGIEKKKNKILFVLFWIIMISGILFSRISSSSLFNGTNFISKFVYFGGLILFAGYFLWLYFHDKIKIKSELILIASWLFIMLIAARGAIRLFFVITPFVCFMVSYSVIKLFNYAKKSKEEVLKLILFAVLILVIIGLIISSFNFATITIRQAKYTGPSANPQWQNAMSWVRENTPENSIFVHWWDYGYWVQYLGERPTLADGGQIQSMYQGNHKIGRYILTTPKPETALSFFKTMNISYLLIDPTDIGKYSAYSGIGSDESGSDRFAWIPTMLIDEKQTQETNNQTIYVYSGGTVLDSDITYNENEKEIFLPEKKAIVGGIILETMKSKEVISLKQPEGVFFYNEKQTRIPLRYIYYNGEILDFENGLEVVIYIIPKVDQTSQGIQMNNLGAVIYLSPKVSKSLVSQLYLMNDPFDNYKTIKLVHSEPDPYVSLLKAQGIDLNDFIYFNGIRGPIKIWETINIPNEINIVEEFYAPSEGYGSLDDLKFKG